MIISNYYSLNSKYEKREQYDYFEGTSAHAVALIGWDDNFQNNDGSKGAWIILNSNDEHKNASTVYLPYNTKVIREAGISFLIKENNSFLNLEAKRKDKVKNNKNNTKR